VLLGLDCISISRDELQQTLYVENIGIWIRHIALHLHQYCVKAYCYKRRNFLNAKYIFEHSI